VPELRQLRAFVAVAEELNFTRAADRLHLAQQAVSRSVAQLERELGVTLLERTTHDVTLTKAGATLLDSGRQVLVAVDAAFDQAQAVGRGLAGTVKVGITPAVGARVRGEVVRVLRDGAPEASVSFLEVRPSQIVSLLRDRDLDLAIARTSPQSPEVASAALPPTRATLHVPAGHRLADEDQVRLSQLDGERLLTWNVPGTPFTDLLVTRLAAAGAQVHPVQSVVLGGGEPPHLLAQRAVALLPEGWPVGGEAVVVPLAEAVDLPLLVLWLAGAPSPAVARVREGLASATTARAELTGAQAADDGPSQVPGRGVGALTSSA
jgi:DNA-binding transcriptional LysR family regulator